MVELNTRTDAPVLTRRNGTSHTPLAEVGEAIGRALRSGATREEIQSMLELKVNEHEVAYQDTLPAFPDDDPDTVYTELPPGLIDLPTAAKRYGKNVRTMYHWVRRGRVALRGRLRAPTAGGGYLVVSEDELVAYMTSPRNKGGRPKQTC